jgi:16S rRNA processing protein RimM
VSSRSQRRSAPGQPNVPEPSSVPTERLTLARILRARGRIGEVAAVIFTDFPERLTQLREVWLWDGAKEPRRAAVRACWLHKGQAIFHFEGSDSINDAEKFAGLDVQVPLSERVPLTAGTYYVTDLVGCEVWDSAAGLLGSVREVQFVGEGVAGAPLLAVETAQGELLIPMAEEICKRVDVAARRIEVTLPEGLRELNP